MDQPHMRAGDADRDSTISELREAFAQGRLTPDEFEGRLDSAHMARTFSDLEVLTRDLPRVGQPQDRAEIEQAEEKQDLRKAWASWLGVGVLVNIIWFATWIGGGSAPYYWPIWVIGPWGGAMVIWTLTSRAKRPPNG